MIAMVKSCQSTSRTNDDALSSELQSLSLIDSSDDIKSVIDSLSSISIEDQGDKRLTNNNLPECQGESPGEKNEDLHSSETEFTNSKATQNEFYKKKKILNDDASFKSNLDAEGYISDENNESPNEQSDEENEEKVRYTDAKGGHENRMDPNDPKSNFIQRGPIHDRFVHLQRFNPITNGSRSLTNNYGGIEKYQSVNYSEIHSNIQDPKCNTPETFIGLGPICDTSIFSSIYEKQTPSEIYNGGDGLSDLTQESYQNTNALFDEQNDSSPLSGDLFNQMNIWNQIQYTDSQSGSPGSDSFFHYNHPPTPPKSVSPNPKNREPVDDELIGILTAIKIPQDDYSVLHNDTLHQRWKQTFPHFETSDNVTQPFSSIKDDPKELDADWLLDNNYNPINDINDLIEVKRSEMDIYLLSEKMKIEEEFLRLCDPHVIDDFSKRIAHCDDSVLIMNDEQGDSDITVVYAKKEDSYPFFYEAIYCLQERVKKIRVCCDKPIGKSKKCKVCHNSDPDKFYTPLTFKNKDGDTPLRCSVLTGHQDTVLAFLLSGLQECPEDIRREFGPENRSFYSGIIHDYPIFKPFLK